MKARSTDEDFTEFYGLIANEVHTLRNWITELKLGGFPPTYFYKTIEKIAREHTFDDAIIIHQIKLFIKSHSARTAEES